MFQTAIAALLAFITTAELWLNQAIEYEQQVLLSVQDLRAALEAASEAAPEVPAAPAGDGNH